MSSSRSRLSTTPQAILYYDEKKVVKGPVNYDVFVQRYRSNEWPSVNYKTRIWNGTEFKQWTPIFSIESLFKKLDPKKHRQMIENSKLKPKEENTATVTTRSRHNSVCVVSSELFQWLVVSRLFIFGLSYIVSHIAPFDSSSEMQWHRYNDLSRLDQFCFKYLNCFSHWDGSHFLNIAQFGYEHEKMYAFYPGLPLILNSIILFIKPLLFNHLHKFKSIALLCGIAWNAFIASYLSSLILYYLTIKIYDNPPMARIAAKLFLINPASIFFVSIYTEPTFAFCSFLLMLCCELKYFDFNQYICDVNHMVLTLSIVLCLIIASSLRSNGIILIGFPLFYHIYCNWFVSNKVYNLFAWLKSQHTRATLSISPSLVTILRFISLIVLSLVGLSPWFYFQYFCKQSLCLNRWIAADRAYCASTSSTVYSFVQSNYWHCGCLKRWNINEIGNFILAAPIWFISFHAIRYYIKQFIQTCTQKVSSEDRDLHLDVLLSHKLMPHIIYWLLLWTLCMFYAHVQISTRFICCSCPLLYWFCAQIIYNGKDKDTCKAKDKENALLDRLIEIVSQPTPKLIVSYFVLYFILG
eukprot:79246_1